MQNVYATLRSICLGIHSDECTRKASHHTINTAELFTAAKAELRLRKGLKYAHKLILS